MEYACLGNGEANDGEQVNVVKGTNRSTETYFYIIHRSENALARFVHNIIYQ